MPELDAAAFEALLAHFDIDRIKAGEKYQVLRLKLVKFFQWNRCRHPDDLADAVLDRLAVKICTETIDDLARFALGIARYVQLEAARKESRHVELTDESAGAATRVEDGYIDRFERRRLQGCLQRCLSELSSKERELLGEFFRP